MEALLREFGLPALGMLLLICGLLLEGGKRRGWSIAALVGGFWLLALWAFAGQGSL